MHGSSSNSLRCAALLFLSLPVLLMAHEFLELDDFSISIDSLWFYEEELCDSANFVEICYTVSSDSPESTIFVDFLYSVYGLSDYHFIRNGVSSSDFDAYFGEVTAGSYCFPWDVGTAIADVEMLAEIIVVSSQNEDFDCSLPQTIRLNGSPREVLLLGDIPGDGHTDIDIAGSYSEGEITLGTTWIAHEPDSSYYGWGIHMRGFVNFYAEFGWCDHIHTWTHYWLCSPVDTIIFLKAWQDNDLGVWVDGESLFFEHDWIDGIASPNPPVELSLYACNPVPVFIWVVDHGPPTFLAHYYCDAEGNAVTNLTTSITGGTGISFEDTLSAINIIDTWPPRLDLSCPDSPFIAGSSIALNWSCEEMFPSSDPFYIYLQHEGVTDTFETLDPFFTFTPPLRDAHYEVIIASRDSFCNWGYDTCEIDVELREGVAITRFAEDTICDGMNMVEICYTLVAAEPTTVNCHIRPFAGMPWTELGYSWFRTFFDTDGNIGFGVMPGDHCFAWNLGADYPMFESTSWEIELYTDESFSSRVAPLDSRPPFVSVDCPDEMVSMDEPVVLTWDFDDLFPSDHEQLVTVSHDSTSDTYEAVDELTYIPVYSGSYTVEVAVRDSFCNWGYDTCSFEVERICNVDIARCWYVEERECNDSNFVLICYSLTSSCSDLSWPVEIEMSSDGGSSWDIPITTIFDADGDTGFVYPGLHCFRWLLSEDMPLWEDSTVLRVSVYDSTSAVYEGFLDTAPPRSIVDIDLQPARPLQTRDWYMVEYEDPSPQPVTDGFWVLELCDSVDTFDLDWDTTTIDIPYIDCPDGRIIVALRDSFCNWSYDTLPLSVTNYPPTIYNCPEDTISICIGDTLVHWLALRDEAIDFEHSIDVSPVAFILWEDDTLTFSPPDTGLFRIVISATDILDLSAACSLYVLSKLCPVDTTTVTYNIHRQWNMLSSPLADTVSIDDVFPTSIPPSYSYDPRTAANYAVTEALPGLGFWLLAPDDTTCHSTGTAFCFSLDLVLYRGWNLVGPPNVPVPVSALDTIPEIILPIYTYTTERRYIEVDTLMPGIGYWILASDSILVAIE